MFYTYLWLREDGTPYYVGKGSGSRAYTSWAHGVHKPAYKNRILVQEFPTEKDAFAAEIFLIAYYGRLDLGTGCLRNLTDGGEGPSGVKFPSQKGVIRTQEQKDRISNTLKRLKLKPPSFSGHHHSLESKEKIRHKMLSLPKIIPTCHPKRKHEGRGLCSSCYRKRFRRKRIKANGYINGRWKVNRSDSCL